MISKKTFHIATSSNGLVLLPKILEVVDKKDSIFVWPSALVLSVYLATKKLAGCRVVELGAGAALPSIVCAMMGAGSVLITERSKEVRTLNNIRCNTELNHVSDICSIWPLDWGVLSGEEVPVVDLILGADVFYSGEDSDAVLATAASFIMKNKQAIFLTTYQERSSHRKLVPFLDKYGLVAQEVPLGSFMPAHSEGFDPPRMANTRIDGESGQLSESGPCLPVLSSFQNIFLIQVALRQG